MAENKRSRHKCIICGSVRYKEYMTSVLWNLYACSWDYYNWSPCKDYKEIEKVEKLRGEKEKLTLLKNYV